MAKVRQVLAAVGTCGPGMLLLCVIVCLQSTVVAFDKQNLETSWWKARKNCQDKFDGDLFIPWSVHLSDEMAKTLNSETYYWIGAMESLTWKWQISGDQEPLFEHKGYSTFPKYNFWNYTIDGNCVYECLRRCNQHPLIGLSKTTCYCLTEEQDLEWPADELSEGKCPGNIDEKCGSSSGISVYSSDGNTIRSVKGKYCATAKKARSGGTYTTVLRAESCSAERYSACYDERTPVGCYESPYKFSRCKGKVCTTCSKYNSSYSEKMCTLLKVDASNKKDLVQLMYWNTKYWVRLYTYISRKWNNGTRVHDRYRVSGDSEANQYCLALWRYSQRTNFVLIWRSCDDTYQSICDTGNTDQVTTTRDQMSSTLKSRSGANSVISTERTTPSSAPPAENVSGDHLVGDMGATRNDNIHIGIYVGVAIGLVTCLVLLILLVIFQRQGRLCFKKTERNVSEHCITAADNVAYHLGTGGPSIIIRDTQAMTTLTTNTPSNHPNQAVDVCSPEMKSSSSNENCDYALVSKTRGHYNDSSGQSQIENGSDDNVYNTTQQEKNLSETDNCYHHIVNTENDYDVAGCSRHVNANGETYNHLSDFKREGTSTEDNEDATTHARRQHKVGEDDYGNVGATDYYNIGPCVKERCANYNVGLNTDGHPGEKPSGQGENEDTLYTLATAVSDI